MERKSYNELKELVLEDKIIKIDPIIRTKPGMKRPRPDVPHDGEHTYTGCYKDHGLPYNTDKRSYSNPFLDKQKGLPLGTEQEAFEILLDQKPGALNLYKYNINEPNYWGQFTIRIPKEGITLDLNNPSDALRYRIFMVNPKFANNKQESSILEKEYIIKDEVTEQKQASELGKKKSEAEDYMFKLKKNKKDMLNVLRLLGKRPSGDSDIDWLREELYKIKDEVTVKKGEAGLDKFLAVMKDPQKDMKLLVLDAIDGELIKLTRKGKRVTYTNEETGQFYGTTLQEVVEFFLKKDPETMEEIAIIKERLK